MKEPNYKKGTICVLVYRRVPVLLKEWEDRNGVTHTKVKLIKSKLKNYGLTKDELINCFDDTDRGEMGDTFQEDDSHNE